MHEKFHLVVLVIGSREELQRERERIRKKLLSSMSLLEARHNARYHTCCFFTFEHPQNLSHKEENLYLLNVDAEAQQDELFASSSSALMGLSDTRTPGSGCVDQA